MKGIDYSWGRPGGAAIRAAGFEFAIRYVPYPGDQGKGVSREEIADLHANGIAVALVYESTAERASTGRFPGGVLDAWTALDALAELGFPYGQPVYFAVDQDINVDLYDEVVAYFDGVASVMGTERTGAYGEYEALWLLNAYELIDFSWQALAWSGGVAFEGRHLYQYSNGQTINGHEVDYNEAFAENFGQWKPEGYQLLSHDTIVTDPLGRQVTLGEFASNAAGATFLPLMAQALGLSPETFTDDEMLAQIRRAFEGPRGALQILDIADRLQGIADAFGQLVDGAATAHGIATSAAAMPEEAPNV